VANKRLKGQETQIQVLQDGTLVGAINAVMSFNDTAKFEKKEDGFLGETTNRYDEVFNGYDGGAEMQVSEQGWINFQQAVKARAKRETPNTIFNIVTVDFYANGDSPSRIYPDVSWGPMPKTVGGRGEFVTVSLDFSCGDVIDNLQGIL
jgi:hypothetical protein